MVHYTQHLYGNDTKKKQLQKGGKKNDDKTDFSIANSNDHNSD